MLIEEAVAHLGEVASAKPIAPTSPLAKDFARIREALASL